jgi:hypothetical protein
MIWTMFAQLRRDEALDPARVRSSGDEARHWRLRRGIGEVVLSKAWHLARPRFDRRQNDPRSHRSVALRQIERQSSPKIIKKYKAYNHWNLVGLRFQSM